MTAASGPVGAVRGEFALPGDKSITHRAYLLGLLASGTTEVLNPNRGADCRATLAAVQQLGARIQIQPDAVTVEGTAGRLSDPGGSLDLQNSGTGMRLLCGILAGASFGATLTGDASLSRRPMERVLEPLRDMGARATSEMGHPPVVLQPGATLIGRSHTLATPSAQVKSALLLAAIQARGRTMIRGSYPSRDHTERMLRAFGVPVAEIDGVVSLHGPCALQGTVVDVPGDPSAATFYLVGLGIVGAGEVTFRGVSTNPSRTRHLDVLERMGLQLRQSEDTESAGEPRGTVSATPGSWQGVDITAEEVPWLIDELPALVVGAAFADGVTRVRGAGELRVKESDRLAAVADGLRSIGAAVELHRDGWTVTGSGGKPLAGGAVRSHGDHRIAMAFLMAGLRTRSGVTLDDASMIETSDPYFISNLNQILQSAS